MYMSHWDKPVSKKEWKTKPQYLTENETSPSIDLNTTRDDAISRKLQIWSKQHN